MNSLVLLSTLYCNIQKDLGNYYQFGTNLAILKPRRDIYEYKNMGEDRPA